MAGNMPVKLNGRAASGGRSEGRSEFREIAVEPRRGVIEEV